MGLVQNETRIVKGRVRVGYGFQRVWVIFGYGSYTGCGALININPLLSENGASSTITSAGKNPFDNCELFIDNEINSLSEAQCKLLKGARFYFRKGDFDKAIKRLQDPELSDLTLAKRALGFYYHAIGDKY